MEQKLIEEIKADQELRAYFLDYLAQNMKLCLSDKYTVRPVDRIRIQKEYYSSFHRLTEKLQEIAPDKYIYIIIETVTKHYLSGPQNVLFEQYPN